MNPLSSVRPGQPVWGDALAHTYPAQPTNTPVSVPGTMPPVQAGAYFPVPGNKGEKGEQGEPGPAGPPNSGFMHTQSDALATWLINHNLGFRPAVALFTSGGLSMRGTVLHLNENQVQVNFQSPIAGFARLN